MTEPIIVAAVVAVLLISVAFYMLPSIVAAVRKVPNIGSAVVINIFLGWTFVGWVVALAMALRSRPQQAVTSPHTFPGGPSAMGPPAGAQQLRHQPLPAPGNRGDDPPPPTSRRTTAE